MLTFDGINRLIIIVQGVTDVNVKADVYSSWKKWVMIDDNSKFLPAIRTIGGDPAGDGFAGDLYFMQNNWRVQVDEFVNLNGILYSDDFDSPYIVGAGGGVVASVSNLAFAVATAAAVVEAPTVEEIGDEVTIRLQVILDALEGVAQETTAAAALRSAKLAAALSA